MTASAWSQIAGSKPGTGLPEAATQCSDQEGGCDLAEEDAEALSASTLLLQAGLRQSRGAASTLTEVRGAGSQELIGQLFSVKSRREIELLSTLHYLTNPVPAEVAAATSSNTEMDLWPVMELVRTSREKDDSDPVWASAHEMIRSTLLSQSPDIKEFVRLCTSDKQEQFTKRGCAENAPGSKRVKGTVYDSYYCGSKRSGIDWSGATWQPSDLCNAAPGSAYNAKGICGSLSKKNLVLNFFDSVPKWSQNPLYVNVPSVDCIVGIVNCDIHYCQHCSGRCGNASQPL